MNDKQCFKSSKKPLGGHVQTLLGQLVCLIEITTTFLLLWWLKTIMWTENFQNGNFVFKFNCITVVMASDGFYTDTHRQTHTHTHCLLCIGWMTSVRSWCLGRWLEEHLFEPGLFSIWADEETVPYSSTNYVSSLFRVTLKYLQWQLSIHNLFSMVFCMSYRYTEWCKQCIVGFKVN